MSYSPEILNELKRLSNVITSMEDMTAQQIISNTNLTNMIGQQVQTNTNLINTITELQNQVAQQIITNTNLATQIATLTTITGQLVEVQTRALDERDQANQPLPYDDISLATNIGPIANLNQGTFTWADGVDWPAGDDFYISTIQLTFGAAVEFLKKYEDQIYVYIDDGAGGPGEYYFVHSFTGWENHVGHTTSIGWEFARTIYLDQLRVVDVSVGQAVRIYIHNASGSAISVTVYISGITRTP